MDTQNLKKILQGLTPGAGIILSDAPHSHVGVYKSTLYCPIRHQVLRAAKAIGRNMWFTISHSSVEGGTTTMVTVTRRLEYPRVGYKGMTRKDWGLKEEPPCKDSSTLAVNAECEDCGETYTDNGEPDTLLFHRCRIPAGTPAPAFAKECNMSGMRMFGGGNRKEWCFLCTQYVNNVYVNGVYRMAIHYYRKGE